MAEHTFVGRQKELDEVLTVCFQAANGHGSAVLLEASAGTGKTALLTELQTRLAKAGQQPAIRVAIGRCFDDSSQHNAFQPFAEALVQLAIAAGQGGRRQARTLVVELFTQVAPDLIRLIPGLGGLVQPVGKAATITAQWWLNTEPDELTRLSHTLPVQFVNAFVATAQSHGPLTLVLEDAHWCDRSSAGLLTRLAQVVTDQPLCVIVSYRPEELGPDHPLRRANVEMLRTASARRVRLSNFSPAELKDYVATHYGPTVVDGLGTWLRDHCGGHPLFVRSYLALLEETERLVPDAPDAAGARHWRLTGSLDDLPIPDSIDAVLEQRVGQLSEQERRLMVLASVQGHEFLATVLAKQVDTPEADTVDALKVVERSVGLVAEQEPEAWVREWSDVFRFEHELTRRAFYRQLSHRQRILYHAAVGETLAQFAVGTDRLSRRFILETARHLASGERWQGAGTNYRRAARSSYREGALEVACEVAATALQCLERCEQDSAALAREKVKCIQILLLTSALAWWDLPGSTLAGRLPGELLESAVAIARRAGDPKLLAEMLFLQAKMTLLSAALPEAVDSFREATELARRVGDGLGEVIGMTELGHAMAGLDLAEGLEVQLAAYRLWEQRQESFEAAGVPSAALARHLHRLQATIGTAYFDSGEFGQAENWLKRALEGSRQHRMPDLLSTVTVLAAQLYIATGRFENAEAMLLEALASSANREDAVVHIAYLRALLGKTYLEWERPQAAIEPLEEAMSSTGGSANAAVLPLIHNYYAELLLCPSTQLHDPRRAEQLLRATLHATRESGFARSEVAALMLLSEARRQAEDLKHALAFSREAVERLDEAGPLPALRSEEVYFTHYRILAAAGDPRSADLLRRAHGELVRKANSLTSPEVRADFMQRVVLSRRIQTG
jgi:tetratricopeptide (TPR) repeat protein